MIQFWGTIEKELGFLIYHNYKEFYERFGSIGIDDYIYIVNPTNHKLIDGFIEFHNYVFDAYNQLEKYLDKAQKIKFYDGTSGWLPVGYTTNGDFIFCDSSNVMVTDEGFEEREVYKVSLIEFIQLYLDNNLEFRVLSDGLVGEKHEIEIIMKSSSFENKN